MTQQQTSELLAWLDANPHVTTVQLAICDLNGMMRGKLVPAAYARKALKDAIKLPNTALFFDVWGRDVVDSGYYLETGDADGLIRPTERGFVQLGGEGNDTATLPMAMYTEAGEPYLADPRNVLKSVLNKFTARGLRPVCAFELEFYLCERDFVGGNVRPTGVDPETGNRLRGGAGTYSFSNLDRIRRLLDDLYARCETLNIPAEAAISEAGVGQFEVNLRHSADALRATDEAFLFKCLVRQVAADHKLAATFMAKPFGDDAGSGQHVHVSIIDGKDANVFANGKEEGSPLLHQAIAGALKALPDTMLFFAPHANSYRRYIDSTHVSGTANWGYENRTTAIRIPNGPDAGRRIEHRVSGADANPYLVLAAILGGIAHGIEHQLTPPAPAVGNAHNVEAPPIPRTWIDAITRMQSSTLARELYGDLLPHLFAACKMQELQTLNQIIPQAEYDAYFDV